MNTKYALHAMYGKPVVELSLVCSEFFGINKNTAYQKANHQAFPIPTFRLDNSQRSPFYVNLDDLAEHIDKRKQEAMDEFKQVQAH